jgi:hypothetical protein
MKYLAEAGSAETRQYWELADESNSDGCPNWIARWFLYHKFRYRDGRNRGKDQEKSLSKSHHRIRDRQSENSMDQQYNEVGSYFGASPVSTTSTSSSSLGMFPTSLSHIFLIPSNRTFEYNSDGSFTGYATLSLGYSYPAGMFPLLVLLYLYSSDHPHPSSHT